VVSPVRVRVSPLRSSCKSSGSSRRGDSARSRSCPEPRLSRSRQRTRARIMVSLVRLQRLRHLALAVDTHASQRPGLHGTHGRKALLAMTGVVGFLAVVVLFGFHRAGRNSAAIERSHSEKRLSIGRVSDHALGLVDHRQVRLTQALLVTPQTLLALAPRRSKAQMPRSVLLGAQQRAVTRAQLRALDVLAPFKSAARQLRRHARCVPARARRPPPKASGRTPRHPGARGRYVPSLPAADLKSPSR
jgi:hypothetical protein